jgi:hypothetical protein
MHGATGAAEDRAYLPIAKHEDRLRYWRSILREAERELEAATGRTTLHSAARKLMRTKAELKQLQAENPA